MNVPTLIRSFLTSAAVAGRRIVKFSDAANTDKVALAAAATEGLAGISDAYGADAGKMLDVVQGGVAAVKLGGTVAAGDPLTSDDEGCAVKCVAAAGETRMYVGFAQAPGVEGDEIACLVVPGLIHAPEVEA